MILADTSLWVQYLRAGPPHATRGRNASPAEALDALIEREQVVTCGPVIAELLAGARGDHREQLAEQLGAQPWVDIGRSEWLTAGGVAAQLQEQGQTTPLIDVMIAVCAVRAQAELWTLDGDFKRIANVLADLRVRVFA